MSGYGSIGPYYIHWLTKNYISYGPVYVSRNINPTIDTPPELSAYQQALSKRSQAFLDKFKPTAAELKEVKEKEQIYNELLTNKVSPEVANIVNNVFVNQLNKDNPGKIEIQLSKTPNSLIEYIANKNTVAATDTYVKQIQEKSFTYIKQLDQRDRIKVSTLQKALQTLNSDLSGLTNEALNVKTETGTVKNGIPIQVTTRQFRMAVRRFQTALNQALKSGKFNNDDYISLSNQIFDNVWAKNSVLSYENFVYIANKFTSPEASVAKLNGDLGEYLAETLPMIAAALASKQTADTLENFKKRLSKSLNNENKMVGTKNHTVTNFTNFGSTHLQDFFTQGEKHSLAIQTFEGGSHTSKTDVVSANITLGTNGGYVFKDQPLKVSVKNYAYGNKIHTVSGTPLATIISNLGGEGLTAHYLNIATHPKAPDYGIPYYIKEYAAATSLIGYVQQDIPTILIVFSNTSKDHPVKCYSIKQLLQQTLLSGDLRNYKFELEGGDINSNSLKFNSPEVNKWVAPQTRDSAGRIAAMQERQKNVQRAYAQAKVKISLTLAGLS